jgi:glucosamine--fructose-6-phosphate aminotransferase (isomerizing)
VRGERMASEMAEQPARLAALVARRAEVAERVGPLLEGIVGTVVVARGSSDHAATTGRYLLEMATRRPVASASPSLQTLYRVDVDFHGHLVVAVSQSGRTPEIATYLERAAARGARTVAITNDVSSPLAGAAQAVVELGAGEELAVPATKTVTAEMVGFALLAAAAGDDPGDEIWADLPRHVGRALDDPAPMRALAAWLGDAQRLATVARGPMAGAAEEVALKLQETSSLFATAFSAADLRHGPIALASSGIRVLAFAHPGPVEDDVLELCGELASRGADVRLVGPVAGAVGGWDPGIPELLAPVLAVVRGQQLAYELAVLRGLDPDRPSGLTKVTAT